MHLRGMQSRTVTFLHKHLITVPAVVAAAVHMPFLHAGSNGSTSDPYRLYNLDVFEHAADSPFGLYGSIPLLLAHKQGLTVGAFW